MVRKKLTSMVCGALALCSIGCSGKYEKYNYEGKIGDVKVKFVSEYEKNILTLEKLNEVIIECIDNWEDDLSFEIVNITRGNLTKVYNRKNDFEKPIVDKAQEKCGEYIEKIKVIKNKEDLDSLD